MLADDLSARTYTIGMIQELKKANEGDWTGYAMQVSRNVGWAIPFEMALADPVSRRASSEAHASAACIQAPCGRDRQCQ